jgi:hypothetical protein
VANEVATMDFPMVANLPMCNVGKRLPHPGRHTVVRTGGSRRKSGFPKIHVVSL